MTSKRDSLISDREIISRMSSWVTSARAETLEDMAFFSGAALAQLHLALGGHEVPHALLRDRLALRAAQACTAFAGRPEGEKEVRDAVHLVRDGDLPGPVGDIYLSWRCAVERPVSIGGLGRAFPGLEDTQIARWLDAGQGAPVTRAATVLETVLMHVPHSDVPALVLADAALAQALGWKHLLPLLSCSLKRADLRKRGEDLRLACHRAVITSAGEAVRLSSDLTRRAARLRAVAPKLRAKGAGQAVELFLSRDAVAPWALPLPDRAARRLCDRLVALDAVRELTGRDTFRLYGV
jgi:hypothetical protein